MKFLTAELKKKYMEDFNMNVLPCINDYWAIDSGLKEILININKNQNVQTLFSKRGVLRGDEQSYIYFAITKEVNQKLIQRFASLNKKKYDELFFLINPPTIFESEFEEAGYDEQTNSLSCLSNKEHFNISVFTLTIFDYDLKKHIGFLNDVNNLLSSL